MKTASRFHELHLLKGLTWFAVIKGASVQTQLLDMRADVHALKWTCYTHKRNCTKKKKYGLKNKSNHSPLWRKIMRTEGGSVNIVFKEGPVGSYCTKSHLSSSAFLFYLSLIQIHPPPVTLLMAPLMLHYRIMQRNSSLSCSEHIEFCVKDGENERKSPGDGRPLPITGTPLAFPLCGLIWL